MATYMSFLEVELQLFVGVRPRCRFRHGRHYRTVPNERDPLRNNNFFFSPLTHSFRWRRRSGRDASVRPHSLSSLRLGSDKTCNLRKKNNVFMNKRRTVFVQVCVCAPARERCRAPAHYSWSTTWIKRERRTTLHLVCGVALRNKRKAICCSTHYENGEWRMSRTGLDSSFRLIYVYIYSKCSSLCWLQQQTLGPFASLPPEGSLSEPFFFLQRGEIKEYRPFDTT